MRYSGIQPQYFPRLHYFARIINTDVFMVRDDVQFVRKHKYPDGKTGKSYQADTPIKQSSGMYLLSLHIQHDGHQPIYKTNIAYDTSWNIDHLRTIESNYIKAKNFKLVYPEIALILNARFDSLSQLNIATIAWGLLFLLGGKIEATRQLTADYVNAILKKQKKFRLKNIALATKTSAFKKFSSLSANGKIVTLCREFGATEDYCGGTGVAAYVDQDLFTKNGIAITVQDWKPRSYRQQFAKKTPFIPNLSVIDLLMNVSRNEALSILKG